MLGALVAAARIGACGPAAGSTADAGRRVEVPNFATVRRRVLEVHFCLECHFDGNPDDTTSLESYETALEAVVPGDPEHSDLYTYVHSGKMPKKRPKMPAADERLLAAWIAAGAPR